MKKPDDDASRWEELARREPYFPLLGDDDEVRVASGDTASEAFFETGEADVAALLAALTTIFSGEVRLDSVLDFGCGAGRLTLPLARRAGHVVACDVAPTVLAHARQNAERAGLHNITFQLCDDVTASAGVSFDFVCSLLVFQYISSSAGYTLIQSIASRLNRNGVAALQLRLRRPGTLHQFASLGRRRTSGVAGSPLPFAHVHRYDARLVVRAVEAEGASVVARLPVAHRGADDAVLIVRRK